MRGINAQYEKKTLRYAHRKRATNRGAKVPTTPNVVVPHRGEGTVMPMLARARFFLVKFFLLLI